MALEWFVTALRVLHLASAPKARSSRTGSKPSVWFLQVLWACGKPCQLLEADQAAHLPALDWTPVTLAEGDGCVEEADQAERRAAGEMLSSPWAVGSPALCYGLGKAEPHVSQAVLSHSSPLCRNHKHFGGEIRAWMRTKAFLFFCCFKNKHISECLHQRLRKTVRYSCTPCSDLETGRNLSCFGQMVMF